MRCAALIVLVRWLRFAYFIGSLLRCAFIISYHADHCALRFGGLAQCNDPNSNLVKTNTSGSLDIVRLIRSIQSRSQGAATDFVVSRPRSTVLHWLLRLCPQECVSGRTLKIGWLRLCLYLLSAKFKILKDLWILSLIAELNYW